MEKTFVIIANGGYLKEPQVKKVTLSDKDEDFLNYPGEYSTYDEYCEFLINETCAEFEQGFAKSVVMTLEQYMALPILMD